MVGTPPIRRCSFSLDEKRRVLEHLRASGHVRQTIAHFYPTLPPESYDTRRRLVLGWRRNAREILAGAATRQGAARKRMRKTKTHRPQPPIPRGLEVAIQDQNDPFLSENEQEMAEFDPIELRSSRMSSLMLQDAAQDDRELQNDMNHTQEHMQEEGGIENLIATAVEQSTKRQEPTGTQMQLQPQLLGGEAEDTEIETGTGSGSGAEVEDEKSDAGSSEEETEAAAKLKRSSFSLDEKRRVLEHLAASKNVRETIEKFYPDLPPEEFKTRRRTIWRWRQCKEQIVAGCADDKASARKKMRPRGIVCQRGPRRVEPQDVVDRLLTSVKKSEQRALKRKGNRVLRPAPPVGALLAERQVDAIVFSALGLPPTTQFPLIQPPLAANIMVLLASVSGFTTRSIVVASEVDPQATKASASKGVAQGYEDPTMPKKHDQKMRELGIQVELPHHRELVFEHVEVEGRVVPNHEHHAGPRETPHYHDSQLLVFCVF
ncbi:hypothetical protein PC111_g5760 [Phytophthora cactorum]|nr:hypothetical protein PC111_g5760 [Phytophthora cactorum]KAG2837533.1 hypothetical protein PC112_g4879 [Phytophthora cactorum]KAG3179857.1 hypothetical protein C6341_g7228 [Phytophthora cactorum]KAG4055884.1 hypothetical protein PC123_g9049 [Phytophthora cactorum]